MQSQMARKAVSKRGKGRPSKLEAADYKKRILDAAEQLFAREGLHSVSIRDITKMASVNVALVTYYFGTKQGLLTEVIVRAAAPIIAERTRLLDQCLADSNGRPSVAALITAYVRPVLVVESGALQEAASRRVVGLAWTDTNPKVRALMDSIYNPSSRRLVDLLRTAFPTLGDDELNWRAACMFSVIYSLYTNPGRVRNMVGAEINLKNREAAMRHVVPFLVGGMMQSCAASPASSTDRTSKS